MTPESSAIPAPYILAPIVSLFTALAAFSVIPFGPGWTINGWHVNGEVANVPIGLILIFAISSLGLYGFIVGGWASESKFALLGSMRTRAAWKLWRGSIALSVLAS
jgi:NADH-quinone oxidoreductase subunit H